MSLSNLEQAVLQKAEAEVKKVLDDARTAAAAAWERQSDRLREEHERRVEDARHELEDKLDRETGAKETTIRLRLLKVKNEIIEEVFQKALQGIISLPDDGYRKWIEEQLSRVPKIEGGKVVTNKRDRELVQKLLEEHRGDKGLTFSDKPAPIHGGFLVQGEQADFDYSVEALLAVLRESLAGEVAAWLFGEGET